MKIKEINIENFKRFTNIKITNIPQSAKLVVLLGPNGCGKSSLFDAFKSWHIYNSLRSRVFSDNYWKKILEDKRDSNELININFYDDIEPNQREQLKQSFYFRTAYRNSPEITIKSLSKIYSPLEQADYKKMIDNDSTINDNYQRLVSETLNEFYSISNDNKFVKSLRDELLNKVREPLKRLFPDLLLTNIGLPTEKAEIYFKKGSVEKYGYENLSGGEKAAFDLLLDIVVKSSYYQDTVFCIDEPETHMHTKLQADLLMEIFNLLPDKSQLWIATHSYGMIKEAVKLREIHSDEVVFLNFDGYDFDDTVIIEPSECDSILLDKMLEITLGKDSTSLMPECIIFCEGSTKGNKRKDFDSRCYSNIFSKEYPRSVFYSLGSCSDVEEKESLVDFVKRISPNTKIIRLIDRDDRSEEEIKENLEKGIRVLSRRHIESFLLDDEILKKWCENSGHPELITEILKIKENEMQNSINRGNPNDDIKSVSNIVCDSVKKKLNLTNCGNNGVAIMRDTLSKLITPETEVYKQLKSDIFG